MTHENIFGPDRDDAPGITPVPGQIPPQFTDFIVESSAMHSRSRGWLPAVTIRIATADGAGIVGCMEAGPELLEIAQNIITAFDRAHADVEAGIADGTLR